MGLGNVSLKGHFNLKLCRYSEKRPLYIYIYIYLNTLRHYDIAEILLKLALNTNQSINQSINHLFNLEA
jgi:hypothetical protein